MTERPDHVSKRDRQADSPRAHLRFAASIAAALLSLPASGADTSSVQLAVAPLSREQVLAFYGARGFSAETLASYAGACVLSFTLRNDSDVTLRYRLVDWTADGGGFAGVDAWDKAWAKSGVTEAARIAFRWAQFPPEQEFEPGDWIMGMATPAMRPAGPFRVTARYADEKGQHELVTKPLSCAD